MTMHGFIHCNEIPHYIVNLGMLRITWQPQFLCFFYLPQVFACLSTYLFLSSICIVLSPSFKITSLVFNNSPPEKPNMFWKQLYSDVWLGFKTQGTYRGQGEKCVCRPECGLTPCSHLSRLLAGTLKNRANSHSCSCLTFSRALRYGAKLKLHPDLGCQSLFLLLESTPLKRWDSEVPGREAVQQIWSGGAGQIRRFLFLGGAWSPRQGGLSAFPAGSPTSCSEEGKLKEERSGV